MSTDTVPSRRVMGWCPKCRSFQTMPWFWGPLTCKCKSGQRGGKQRRLEAVR